MSDQFRQLLKQVGSGSHTSVALTREQAQAATEMMLHQVATPAQIGAFMIAHRIKRPTVDELAGMLDAYDRVGPKVAAIAPPSTLPVTVLSLPYDGRSRTAPISPLTALILATAGAPVLMHGGDRMPTKAGTPLIDLWRGLGVNWDTLDLDTVSQTLGTVNLGFVYLPRHFPLAQALVPYREQIGKRPPFATIEIMWSPYGGEAHVVSGYVHPPTEVRTQATFDLRGTRHYTTVKGLEGSCDLPQSRTAIIGMGQPDGSFERELLHPRDFGFAGEDPPCLETPDWMTAAQATLAGGSSPLTAAAIWNGGFYLWRLGLAEDMAAGLVQAETLLSTGAVAQHLSGIQQKVTDCAYLSPV
jgi:anthranilate phosphoribosyltransferase